MKELAIKLGIVQQNDENSKFTKIIEKSLTKNYLQYLRCSKVFSSSETKVRNVNQ